MRRMGLLLTLALGAFLAQDALAATAPPAVSLSLASIPRTSARGARYSATRVDDLEFTATISPQVRGAHRLSLKVFTPRGHLYQTLSASFSVSPVAPRKRPPLVAKKVSARLPVSGTLIATNSLYGRWKVVPFLDDAPNPCGRELRFEITK